MAWDRMRFQLRFPAQDIVGYMTKSKYGATEEGFSIETVVPYWKAGILGSETTYVNTAWAKVGTKIMGK
jgi:hypothetical protein